MRWLVQEFLNNSSNMFRIMKALDSLGTDYLLIKLDSCNRLKVLDKETRVPLDDSNEILNRFISNEKVMVYGSKAFVEVTKEMNLEPGSFTNKNFEFDVFRNHLGNELLNDDFIIGELLDLEPIDEKFFIRPTGNTKLFSGMVITKEEFFSWQTNERRENSPYIGESLMICTIKEIEAEYRFFVVNQEIITYSSYKVGNNIDTSKIPSKDLIIYTQDMIDKFPLSKAFVIDVAETNSGYKVVEYNNINTSGLYGCDEISLVKKINELYEMK